MTGNNMDEKYDQIFHKLNQRLLNDGKSPLLQKGVPERDTPFDPVSGMVHDNVNGMMLDNVSAYKGFKDPRWLKSTDLEKKGFFPKYGEKPAIIAYMNKYNEQAKGIERSPGEKKYYFVYNAEQIQKYPSLEKDKAYKKIKEDLMKERRDNIKKNTKGKNPLDVVRDMVQQSNADQKEFAFAYASYRLAQDQRVPYVPRNPNKIIEESRASTNSIMKSSYFGGIQVKKLSNKDVATFDRNSSREHTRAITHSNDIDRGGGLAM